MSTHRGCKEMDIILGNFAQNNLDKLTSYEITIFETLLSEPDAIIYDSLVKIICEKQAVDSHLKYAEELLIKISHYKMSR